MAGESAGDNARESAASAPESPTPRRLGILGGSFDPIHLGHLATAEEARCALDLDEVLIIPASQPVFKRDRTLAPASVRLAMCRAACASNPAFRVSSLEIDRGGLSYTIDTLRALREIEPPSTEFYFIVGSDALEMIDRWREAESIAAMVTVVCEHRPGWTVAEERRRSLEALGFRFIFMNGPDLDISSTEVRRRVADGLPIRYHTGSPVADLIERSGLYRTNRSQPLMSPSPGEVAAHSDVTREELLSREFYRRLREELADRVGKKRLKHSVGVAKTAKRLAEVYGEDPALARLAGILHDWDKGLDPEQMRDRVAELGMEAEVDPWSLRESPLLLHGHTAARAMKMRYPALPDEVVRAIERHTTAARDMSDLDKILYIADALEPGRNFRDLDDLRAMVGQVDLDELFFLTYRLWVELLMERGRALHPDTIDLWNAFATARNARKEASE